MKRDMLSEKCNFLFLQVVYKLIPVSASVIRKNSFKYPLKTVKINFYLKISFVSQKCCWVGFFQKWYVKFSASRLYGNRSF